MSQNKDLLTVENITKLCSLLLVCLIQYFAIKSDMRDLVTEKKYQNAHFQYQIDELKDCCGGKNNKQISFSQPLAIQPNTIELENYDK